MENDDLFFVVERLTISYENPTVQDTVILDSASWEVRRNLVHFLLGPNGSGKTSLFRTLIGLQHDDLRFIKMGCKEQRISGRELTRQIRVGYIPQYPSEALVPTLPVVENLYLRQVLLGTREFHNPMAWFSKAFSKKRMAEFVERLSSVPMAKRILDGRLYDTYRSFSGGELQLLNLAAAVCADLELLVMDEPTGKLDLKNRMAFWNALAELLSSNNLTVLTTTHEESFRSSQIVQSDHRIFSIHDKKIVAAGRTAGNPDAVAGPQPSQA